MPPEISLPTVLDAKKGRYLLDPFIILAKHKLFILFFVCVTSIFSLLISLLLPRYYTANARLLPPQQNQSFASAMLSQLGQLGPLIGAATVGKDLGIRNPNDIYVGMLHSRTLADKIIDRFSLMSVYRNKKRKDTQRRLQDLTEIIAGKDGIISISVEDHSPPRAAQIANAYIEELEELTRSLAVTDAAKRRVFFERELKVANDELTTAEQALRRTEESTGIIQLDSQSKVILQAYADLRAQVSGKEVQVQSMRSFATPENPDLIRIEHELSALRAQLANFERGQAGRSSVDVALEKVPGAGLEYIRKLREVKYRETLFELLAKEYEAARIDEAKDSSVIQVLDKAVPPEDHSWPPRTLITLSTTLLAFMIAALYVYFSEAAKQAKADPEYLVRLDLLKLYLLNRHKPMKDHFVL